MNGLRTGVALISLSLFLLLSGCESSGGGSTGENGARGGSSSSTGGVGDLGVRVGSGDRFDPAARSRMNMAWDAFKKESPEWPRRRAEWIALGRRATNTLVENLFRAMILFRLANYPRGIDRCRMELVLLGEHAVPTLAGVLREPTYLDSNSRRKEKLPTGIITDVAEVLSLVGPAAVPSLTDLCRSRHASVRRACLVALGRTKHPSALSPLERGLESSDWIDRMTAAKGLGLLGNRGGVSPLVDALSDSEPGVVKEAARSLARLKAREALSALDRRREQARSDGRHDIAAACGAAAKTIRSGR